MRRYRDASGAFAEGLDAWSRDPESESATAARYHVAEVLNCIYHALTKRAPSRGR